MDVSASGAPRGCVGDEALRLSLARVSRAKKIFGGDKALSLGMKVDFRNWWPIDETVNEISRRASDGADNDEKLEELVAEETHFTSRLIGVFVCPNAEAASGKRNAIFTK